MVDYREGRVKIWTSNQGPFRIRNQLADSIGVAKPDITVEYIDVGGAFGTKSFLYPETFLTYYASVITKRPVKWVETRSEHLKATTHACEVKAKISLAVRRDGKAVGLNGLVYADIGAYNIFINANYAPFIERQLTGPYDIPAAEVRAVASLQIKPLLLLGTHLVC
jgi:carbon-monoxide dehydrogenase large subunit